ncbi:MAG TPA: signal peptidase I [bacterium]|nr:signal peptidase I [bacterium]
MKHRLNRTLSASRIIIAATIVAALLKLLVFDLVLVRGESMRPTIEPGSVVVVARCAYGLRVPFINRYMARWAEPKPGDLVLVSPSPGGSRRAIKRVLEIGPAFMSAEAGVLHGRGGSVTLGAASARFAGTNFVPGGRLFIVGDNAEVSFDSRDYGSVPIETIAGRVVVYHGWLASTVSRLLQFKEITGDVDR